MDQRTVTRIPSEYAPAGFEIIRPEAGSRPEPTSDEREAAIKADLQKYSEFKTEQHLSDEDVEFLQGGLTFPPAIGRAGSGWHRLVGQKSEAVFSRAATDAFIVRLKRMAALVR
jgi:hypothetical protein